jgi:hypothetical protein
MLGFNCSALFAPNQQLIDRWNPPLTNSQEFAQFTDAASATVGDVVQDVDNVQGTSRSIYRIRSSGNSHRVTNSSSQAQVSAGDSAVEFEIAIPSNAEDMQFNFRFSELGDGDWMTVSFNDEVLYSFLGRSFLGVNYDEAVMPVSNFAGQTGVIRVILHAASATATEVRVSNFHFESSAIVTASTLGNISTRVSVRSGDNVLIGGMIATGTAGKRVILRAIGPSLTGLGISGALENPTLELFQGSTLLMSNDDWQNSSQQAEIAASGFAPSNTLESAIIWTLTPGQGYTAIVRGANGTTGVGVVEAYDLDHSPESKLGNISTRGFVDVDENVMIAGLIVGPGNGTSATILARALGPTLGDLGVSGVVADPTLDLVNSSGTVIRSSNNWQDDSSQRALIEAAGLAPGHLEEAALVETVPPGAYTAIVRGNNRTNGVGLVEAYHIP